jgi:pimeloyl-ACP methyl ester carboxylesterase
MESFAPQTAPAVLEDLRTRLRATRWPDVPEDAGWSAGTDVGYLRELVAHWAGGFDWPAREAELNAIPRFRATVGGHDIHFAHVRGTGPAFPLVLTHGWPDSFWRYTKVIPLLTDPGAHGGDPADAFDVIVPDVPGFGYSARPATPLNSIAVAGLWAGLIGKQVNPAMPADLRAEVDAAAVEFRAYFADLIALRRAEPRDDLTSALLARPTPDAELMSADDALNSLLVLFGGGYETTAGALGLGIHALLTHPEQFALLAGDPGLAAGAAEETLRWDGAAQMSQRAAARPAVLAGVEIPAEDMVVVLMGAANRDPARFPDPDRFDITRDGGRGLFFGHGLHLCLGAALARLEMTVLLEQLGKRFPALRIAGEVQRRPNPALRGMAALPLTR